MDEWTLTKVLPLPNDVLSVKHIDFIPQPFDGGCNRLLGILSGTGRFYFYDVEETSVLNTITGLQQIIKFVSTSDGKYLACLLCTGEVCVYDVAQYVVTCKKSAPSTSRSDIKSVKLKKNVYKKCIIKNEVSTSNF